MIIAGIIIGPYSLNLLDSKVLDISNELRRIALIIIIIRAGLKLDLNNLRKVGKEALLMSFLPASFEILAFFIFGPILLGFSRIDSLILGSIIAAVSPAVVVPRMIILIDEKLGTDKQIPEMILSGASLDDVFVIVLFSSFISLGMGENISIYKFIEIPISIILALIVGLVVGYFLSTLFNNIKLSLTNKTIIIFVAAFFLNFIEFGQEFIPFASLIGIMAMGIIIRLKSLDDAINLSLVFDKLWLAAEMFLFVLVGSSVQIGSLKEFGLTGLIIIFIGLIFRSLGVFTLLIGSKLNLKEKLFTIMAYIPKATVQAAIGSVPLAMGLKNGKIMLTISVLAILTTAPLGAFLIDHFKYKLLNKEG
ncbi:cation:proton antiporter [Citroniella saccharovorans]|uniref:Cation:proton antiporter n=2 Tax=Citroniella saccharovorans TaxID=2053367 RepID=A0AAW9MPB4_9FIRM|nr:cation:proton antiporter [Citroniella saccharovorans]MEB3429368.1 cation:proton antiporter [Citroniella saccharovorans]